jgi:hypothetical protein
MNRIEMVKRLINEGLSKQTLVNFTDKQLKSLCGRMLNEQPVKTTNVSLTDIDADSDEGKKAAENFLNNPNSIKPGTKFSLNEKDKGVKKPTKKQLSTLDKNKNGKIDKEDFKMLRSKKSSKEETKEELKGNQTKLDANKNGKIDKEDFKLLKKGKTEVKEGGEKWIKKAIDPSKKGSLKKALGVKKDEKIPETKLKAASKKGGKLGQRARLAMTLKKLKENYEVSEWVNDLAEKNYHPFTSKGEIMELLVKKLNETETVVPMPKKAKIGHNSVPEFMTYNAIKSSESNPTSELK